MASINCFKPYNKAMDENENFYKAMLSRDCRFDGKFFVGVKTTGIYCRPICPAKPKFKNVEFFKDAMSAEKAGYRPCLRCHPEFSPEYPVWQGKSPIVQKALQMISQNAIFEEDIETFSNQFNISSRHLRRLFEEEVGLSPKQVSDIHRLNFAYKLINETALSLTEIALASGFKSLRRFNDAFKKRYKKAPRIIRKDKKRSEDSIFTLHIPYRPPLDFENLLHYFRMHQIPYLERVPTDSYERVFKIKDSLGSIYVTNDKAGARFELRIHTQDPKVLFPIVNRIRKMFDLNSDPILIGNHFAQYPDLGKLWEEFPGLRIARGWEPFEIAIGTILGQVVSVKQAAHLMGELVKHYGEKITHPITQEESYLFPSPEILSEASLDEIKTTSQRKEAIRALSKAYSEELIHFREDQDIDAFKAILKTIKGVGDWSAEYICLRALGDTNAFPKGDLIIDRALKIIRGINPSLISPWQGYLAIYLWKKYAKGIST